MSHPHLGQHVCCDHLPGLTGTVVYVNEPSGMWRAGRTFDVLWDDGSCTRRVAQALIDGPGWAFQNLPRETPQRCAEMWHEYQLRRVELMQRNAARVEAGDVALPGHSADAGPATPTGPEKVSAPERDWATAFGLASHKTSAREATAAIKACLAERYPALRFAVHCDAREAKISWVDGPVAGPVFTVSEQVANKAGISKVKLSRSFSEAHVQAALNYCLARIHEEGVSESEARRLSAHAHASEYQSSSLDGVIVECNGPASGLSLQLLARVVITRWDDVTGKFANTRIAEGLKLERAAMFPYGDQLAAIDFRICLVGATDAVQVARREVDGVRV